MNSKNIVWINNIKAISILSVLLVHCQSYYNYWLGSVNIFIHPFYVNAFFFVSGYLLFRKQLSEPLINQRVGEYITGGGKKMVFNILYRLIIPTVLFSAIEFFPSHILRDHGFDTFTFLYKTIGGCTYWFTAALVVAELTLVVMLLTRIKKIEFYCFYSLLVFSMGYYLVSNNLSLIPQYPSLPWQYKHGFYAIIFMAIGGLYWRYEKTVAKIVNKYTILLMIALYISALLWNPDLFRVLVSMLDLNIEGIVLSMLSIIILIKICKIIPPTRFLDYVGKNTIGFYFMSGALPIVLSMAVHKFMPNSTILGLMIVFLGTVGIAFIAVYLMNRFIPWVFDLRKLKIL